MGVSSIGTRTSGSLGTTKSDAAAVTNEAQQLSAAQYNTLADAVIDCQTAIGTTASPAAGSLEARVVDHETRVAANEADITDHETRVTANEADIASHDTTIAGHTTSIADHETRITANEADIADHETRVTANEADIADHETRIAVLESGFKGVNSQAGSYTAVLADAGKLIDVNAAGANDQTIPPNSSVAYPVGAVLAWAFRGAGVGTIVEGVGVTAIVPPGLSLVTQGQGSWVYAVKVDTDTWMVTGHLEAA